MITCSFPGCDREMARNGLCWAHRAQQRSGAVLFPIGSHRLPLSERFWAKVDKNGPVIRPELGPCWIWTGGKIPSGYGTIRHAGKAMPAHRASWLLNVGEIPRGTGRGTFVLHCCDNPPCVNPAHLFLGDHAANMRDMAEKGRARPGTPATYEQRRRGVDHQNAKLTNDDVREIRRRAADGESLLSIASSMKVTHQNIRSILRGATWGHVK